VSIVPDTDLPPGVRARLLSEIRSYLPAFLHRGASEQGDPAGDVRELLNLEAGDLQRVVAVHQSLDEAVLAFGEALRHGLRHPVAASVRPREVSQSVRGPVDWSATSSRRALEAGNPSLFVVRPAQRVFDTPENRALVWLLDRLQSAARVALREVSAVPAEQMGGESPSTWAARIRRLSNQVQGAYRVGWLQGIGSEVPTPNTIKRLKASRSSFYAGRVAPAVEAVIALRDPSSDVLAEVLSRRYFEPAANWLIFEVYVALSLARAFAKASGRPRKIRLLVGGGRAAFARYAYEDGSEVALIYQGWPPSGGRSLRLEASERHGLRPSSSRPDIFIVRSGPDPDAAILELKATYSPAYLGAGLSQLLGYLAERPEIWKHNPAGWLVAPASDAFTEHSPGEEDALWMVSAEQLSKAAVERFVPAETTSAKGR
jgi:hypothetical protein